MRLCSCTCTHAEQWIYIYLKQNGLANTSILKNTPGIHNGPRKKRIPILSSFLKLTLMLVLCTFLLLSHRVIDFRSE